MPRVRDDKRHPGRTVATAAAAANRPGSKARSNVFELKEMTQSQVAEQVQSEVLGQSRHALPVCRGALRASSPLMQHSNFAGTRTPIRLSTAISGMSGLRHRWHVWVMLVSEDGIAPRQTVSGPLSESGPYDRSSVLRASAGSGNAGIGSRAPIGRAWSCRNPFGRRAPFDQQRICAAHFLRPEAATGAKLHAVRRNRGQEKEYP
jgi:hypothetical protein